MAALLWWGAPGAAGALAYHPGLFWLLVPFSLLVAASRVVLGLHYPSDVLAGAAVGGSIAITSIAVLGMIQAAAAAAHSTYSASIHVGSLHLV